MVPWQPGCPHREAAWAWAHTRYLTAGHTVVEGRYPPGPLRKAAAIIDGAPADGIVVVADADVWCDELDPAIAAVADGAPWAIPHGYVHRLDEPSTAAVLAGAPLGGTTTERPYHGTAGGGIVVLTADTLHAIPPDPRFAGWGQEDESWAAALDVLAGPAWRGRAPLWHLWHPPQPRLSRRHGSRESTALSRRYMRARWVARKKNDRRPMRALLEEVNRWLTESSSTTPPSPTSSSPTRSSPTSSGAQ